MGNELRNPISHKFSPPQTRKSFAMSSYTLDSIIVNSQKKTHIILDFLFSLYGSQIPSNHTPFHKNKLPTRITCIKCKLSSHDGKSKSFRNLESATKHLLKVHSSKSEKSNNSITYPTFSDIFTVYEKISICLEDSIPISTIPEVNDWRIEVK